MDELTNALSSSSFQVSASTNNIFTKHPRFSQYKQRTSKDGNQDVRRDNFLKQQRKRRCDFLDHVRCLAVGEWVEKDSEREMDVSEVKMRPPKKYKDQLMLSEWLVEVPLDFEKEWLMIVCPKGKRNLVVAAKGRTACYSKSGYCIEIFSSVLPGGSPKTNSGYTVLDCIYSPLKETFYVLDVMCWNNHPVYDSETEFRFFWLQSKLQESSNLAEVSQNNKYKIIGLPSYNCTKEEIFSALITRKPKDVDGLLFYHKRTHYTFGVTPLVTWLKVPMIKDILDISPPHAFVTSNPEENMI